MARYKKSALLPWLSARSDGKEGRFIQVGNSLLLSRRFQALSSGAQFLYLCMAMECGGRRDFLFPLTAARKYGIGSSALRRHARELASAGFLSFVSMKSLREPNVYHFASSWDDTPRPHKTDGNI